MAGFTGYNIYNTNSIAIHYLSLKRAKPEESDYVILKRSESGYAVLNVVNLWG